MLIHNILPLPPGRSSYIWGYAYDEGRRRMAIRFKKSGRVRFYENMPLEIAQGFVSADSMGRYFNAHIRHKFGKFCCESAGAVEVVGGAPAVFSNYPEMTHAG